MVLTPTKNATKPNPLESIPVQPTRKEENWKIKEEMEGAAVTLETERGQRAQPLTFMMMMNAINCVFIPMFKL